MPILLNVKRALKRTVANMVGRCGYQIAKRKAFDENTEFDAFQIQQYVMSNVRSPGVIFDIGANRGQSIAKYRALFPSATIHSFEPVPEFFQACQVEFRKLSGVVLNNCAMGDQNGEISITETAAGQSTSVLTGTGNIRFYFSEGDFTPTRTYKVPCRTVDKYCAEKGITSIDILKIDTEGFELSVLRGAKSMLEGGRISQIYCEVNFASFWTDCTLYHHVANYLESFGFELFAIYGLGSGAFGASRSADALFMRSELKQSLLAKAVATKA